MHAIKPLYMCKMQRYKSIFTYNANMGEMIWAAVQAWLVEGDNEIFIKKTLHYAFSYIKTRNKGEILAFFIYDTVRANYIWT